MKNRIDREKIKYSFPYFRILLIVIVAEVFIFNFSTWKTLFCEPVILARDVVTDEKGVYETEFTTIQGNVKNVNVDLTITGYDRATVKTVLTDAGNFYEYALEEYEVVPGVEGDGYQNIYPFGEVEKIQLIITVPEGTQAQIASAAVNVNRPMDFKVVRVGLLFFLLSLGYVIFQNEPVMCIGCVRGCKWQFAVTLSVMLVLMMLAGWMTKSNPVCVNSPWPHHRQYQELAHSLKEGTVVIDENPDSAILEKENPYDTSALLAEGIPFRMDYALYDGNYYAYFGIVPELLFFLPYYLITGQDLQNYIVVFAFYCMMLVGIFATLWEVILRFGKKVPYVFYLILSCAVGLLSNYVFMLGRPDIYNIPIMGGNAFTFLGAFFWMRAIWMGKRRRLWLSLGSLCFACVVGCRPQLILYGAVLFLVLFLPRFCTKEFRKGLSWKDVVCFLAPAILVGGIVCGYNYARFDSVFNFGATYSLTSNDMNNRGFNFSRVIRGLYSFLFQPPVIHASFPFLESAILEGNYMGKNITEFCYGGIFATCPLLISLFYMPLGGYKKYEKEEKRLIGGLCLASFIIGSFDINGAGLLQRYMGDMVFGFMLASIVVLTGLLGRRCDATAGGVSSVSTEKMPAEEAPGTCLRTEKMPAEEAPGTCLRTEKMSAEEAPGTYLWTAKLTYLAVLCSVAFSFLVFITSEDGICLQEYNPQLFHWIMSYFKF